MQNHSLNTTTSEHTYVHKYLQFLDKTSSLCFKYTHIKEKKDAETQSKHNLYICILNPQ